MATDSQGVTLTWAGSSQAEVVSLSIDGVSSQFVETTSRLSTLKVRDYRPHDIDPGTVTVTMRTKGNLTGATFGAPQALSIARGGSEILSASVAFLEQFAWSASVGELQEYRAVFRLSGSVNV